MTLVVVAIVVAEEEAVVRSIWADRGDLVVQVTAEVVYVGVKVSQFHLFLQNRARLRGWMRIVLTGLVASLLHL